jgi:hypothetical protein
VHLPQIIPLTQLATSGLAALARPTSRVAGITARAKVDTPRKRQEMIARFAVELESNA